MLSKKDVVNLLSEFQLSNSGLAYRKVVSLYPPPLTTPPPAKQDYGWTISVSNTKRNKLRPVNHNRTHILNWGSQIIALWNTPILELPLFIKFSDFSHGENMRSECKIVEVMWCEGLRNWWRYHRNYGQPKVLQFWSTWYLRVFRFFQCCD